MSDRLRTSTVAPHGHTIERCHDHAEMHCTRCCGVRPVGDFDRCEYEGEKAGGVETGQQGGFVYRCALVKGHKGMHRWA